jgi:Outer membrane protein beta-barrel domain
MRPPGQPLRFRNLALILGLLCISQVDVSASDFEVGLALGGYRSTLKGDTPENYKFARKLSGTAGLSIMWRVAPDVAILFEPGYTVRGTKLQAKLIGEARPIDVYQARLPYISLPVSVRIHSDSGKWFVSGGLEFGWLQSAELERLDGELETIDITDQVTPFDAALTMGLGVSVPRMPLPTAIEVRYSQGLVNLDDGIETAIDDKFSSRFRSNDLGVILRMTIPFSLGSQGGDGR